MEEGKGEKGRKRKKCKHLEVYPNVPFHMAIFLRANILVYFS